MSSEYDDFLPASGAWALMMLAERRELESEIQRLQRAMEILRQDRKRLRISLMGSRSWVGVCPFPNTQGFEEMKSVLEDIERTLAEVSE